MENHGKQGSCFILDTMQCSRTWKLKKYGAVGQTLNIYTQIGGNNLKIIKENS